MYAVIKDGTCTVNMWSGRQSSDPAPAQSGLSIEVVTMEEGKTAADYLVGRVCHVGIET